MASWVGRIYFVQYHGFREGFWDAGSGLGIQAMSER